MWLQHIWRSVIIIVIEALDLGGSALMQFHDGIHAHRGKQLRAFKVIEANGPAKIRDSIVPASRSDLSKVRNPASEHWC